MLSCRPSEAETRLSYAGLADLLGGVAGRRPAGAAADPAARARGRPAARRVGGGVDERAVAAAFLAGAASARRATVRSASPSTTSSGSTPRRSRAAVCAGASRRRPVAALLTVRGECRRGCAACRNGPREVEVDGSERRRAPASCSTRGSTRRSRGRRCSGSGRRRAATRSSRSSWPARSSGAGARSLPARRCRSRRPWTSSCASASTALSPAALEVARVVAAVAEPTTDLVEAALGAPVRRPGSPRRSRRGSSSSTESASASPIRSSDPRSSHARRPRAAARCTPGSRRSSRPPRSEPVTSRSRRPSRTTTSPRSSRRRRGRRRRVARRRRRRARRAGAPADAARDATMDNRRVSSSPPTGTTPPGTPAAPALLEDALPTAAPGTERATVLVQLADVQRRARERRGALPRRHSRGRGDDALQATIHLNLAGLMRLGDGHRERRRPRPAGRPRRLARRRRRAPVPRARGHGRLALQLPGTASRAEMEEALALERRLPEWPLVDGPTGCLCHQLVWSVDLEPRGRSSRSSRGAPARERPGGEAGALWYLGLLEWRAGNWDEADRYAAASMDLGRSSDRVCTPDDFPSAIVAAHRGRIDDARESGRTGAIARGRGRGHRITGRGTAGCSASSSSRWETPRRRSPYLRRSYEIRNAFMLEPAQRLELGDLLEALIAVGELDEAEAILDLWEARADARPGLGARDPRPLPGLVLAARGDLDGAFASFERALAEHDRGVRSVPPRDEPCSRSAGHSDAPRTCRRAGHPRGHARRSRGSAPPLGRADPGRAGPHRRPRLVPRRPDGSRAPHRRRSSPRATRTTRSQPRSSSPSTPSRPR